MRVICFDLDDTLYKEIDYLKSAYREIAEYAAGYCTGCSDSVNILAIKAYNRMLDAYREGLNALGWKTVCLKDDGRNIHRQEVEDIEEGMLLKRWIEKLEEVILESIWR